MTDGNKRLRVETVRGEPYHVAGRRLIPVARVISFGRAKATIGKGQAGGRGRGFSISLGDTKATLGRDRVSGWGGAFAHVTPLEVVEETPDGECRIPITDGTATALRGIALGAVAVILFFRLIRLLARRLAVSSSRSVRKRLARSD
jgi:uncharacterized spore protein YtfJ